MAFFLKPILILIDEDFVVLKHLYSGGKYFILSLMAAIIGLLAFYLGYYSQFRRTKINSYLNKYNKSRALMMFFMSIIGGIGGYLYLIYSSGGRANFITSAFISRGEFFVGKGYILIISFFCWLAVATCVSYIYHKGGKFYKSLLFYLIFIIMLLILSSYASRTAFLSLMLIPVIYFHFRYRKINLKKALILLIILFAIVTAYDVYRQPEIITSKYAGTLKDKIKTSIGSSFAEIDGFSIILEHIPSKRDFFYGQVELEGLIYPLIPRAIYPDKKLVWGTSAIQEVYMPHYLHRFTSFSVSIFGPGYADFGWVGIIMSMFFLGFIFKYLYIKFKQNENNDGTLFLYIFFICNVVNIVRDGINVFLALIPYLFVISIIFRYIETPKIPMIYLKKQ
jgi:oligosaccharide repeat unit polymerase